VVPTVFELAELAEVEVTEVVTPLTVVE
jgi:hypothetical protein